MSTNYNNQAQAVILKGIASQLLQMNKPTINEAANLFNEFNYQIITQDTLHHLQRKINDAECRMESQSNLIEVQKTAIASLESALNEERNKTYIGKEYIPNDNSGCVCVSSEKTIHTQELLAACLANDNTRSVCKIMSEPFQGNYEFCGKYIMRSFILVLHPHNGQYYRVMFSDSCVVD